VVSKKIRLRKIIPVITYPFTGKMSCRKIPRIKAMTRIKRGCLFKIICV
jgi:hypothetical protein